MRLMPAPDQQGCGAEEGADRCGLGDPNRVKNVASQALTQHAMAQLGKRRFAFRRAFS
jgi:hypothetical protein